ncbi:hypothetical protein PIB30_079544 [Stylosanthes scabra]|uniref:Uncharacterized protein n=1 Tax=Stylosanthes scabra TaxID=79078 RepID=A0ABU6TQR1_9FABA|nr:hypothetical protein [Stylosanthes scabra]
MRDLKMRELEKKREIEVRMSEKERGFDLKVKGPSRGRAMTRARARGQMGAQKRALMGHTDARSEGRRRADLPVVGPRAPSARARTRHGHRADARPCACAKRGAQTRHKLVLLRPNVIKLTTRMRQGHRAGARGVRERH